MTILEVCMSFRMEMLTVPKYTDLHRENPIQSKKEWLLCYIRCPWRGSPELPAFFEEKESLTRLVQECWHQEPGRRPTSRAVTEKLFANATCACQFDNFGTALFTNVFDNRKCHFGHWKSDQRMVWKKVCSSGIIYVDDPTLGLWLFFDTLIIFHLSGGSDIAFLWSTNMHADFNDHILFNWASTLVLSYFDDFSLTNCLLYVSYPIQDVEQSWYWWFFLFLFLFLKHTDISVHLPWMIRWIEEVNEFLWVWCWSLH